MIYGRVVFRVWSVQRVSAGKDLIRATSENQDHTTYHRHGPNVYHLMAKRNVFAFLIHKTVGGSTCRTSARPLSMKFLNVCVSVNVSVKFFWCTLFQIVSRISRHMQGIMYSQCFSSSSLVHPCHPHHPPRCPKHQVHSPSPSSSNPSIIAQAVHAQSVPESVGQKRMFTFAVIFFWVI